MRDGKALQMGTSHELGQNFAKAFDIVYQDEAGTQQHCWTTSWGTSTRMIGGLIMAHGDDTGLRVPPRLASDPGRGPRHPRRGRRRERPPAARTTSSSAAGVRSRLDDRTDISFGRRATDWELKGVPVRVEVGPRDLANEEVTLVRRDTGEKEQVEPDARSAAGSPTLLDDIQRGPPRRGHGVPRRAHRRRDDDRRGVRGGPDRLRPDPVGHRSARTARPASPRTASPCAASSDPTARCPTPRTSPTSWPSWPAPTDRRLSRAGRAARRPRATTTRSRGASRPRRGRWSPRSRSMRNRLPGRRRLLAELLEPAARSPASMVAWSVTSTGSAGELGITAAGGGRCRPSAASAGLPRHAVQRHAGVAQEVVGLASVGHRAEPQLAVDEHRVDPADPW